MKYSVVYYAPMPFSVTYSPELVSSALLGYIRGYPQRAIAEMLRIPRGTLRYWIDAFDEGRLDPEAREHDHHWIIGSPQGPESSGICKICFDQRDFKNSLEANVQWRGSSAS